MTDAVTIRRCVLRIRRHGGWSWGPDPDALLGAATRALPRLIAQHVEATGLVRADGDVHITTPLRLHVRATVEELVALAAAARLGDGDVTAPASLTQRLDEAFAQALGAASVDASPRAERAVPPEEMEPQAVAARPRSEQRSVLELLHRWHRAGVLVEILRALPAGVRDRWLVAMSGKSDRQLATEQQRLPFAPSSIAAASGAIEQLAGEQESVVVVLAAIAAALACEPGVGEQRGDDARIVAAVIEALPIVRAAVAAVRERAGGVSPGVARDGERERDAIRISAAAREASEDRVADLAPFVTSALPFLALVPLARCGWLDAAAAILDGAGQGALAPALGASIAYKLLAPPEHGWLRTPEQRSAAIVLAGRAIEDGELADAELPLAGVADAVVAPLTAELRRGHRRGAPWLLVRDGERFALIDCEGMFVVASARELVRVIDAARGAGDVVLVPAAVASPRVLDALECANLVFVTDAPPARDAPWRRVPRARLWTNDGGAAERHAGLAEVLADAGELAGEALDALRARPVVPRSERDVLDRIATQAAGLALGDIAWNLFRARETPTPMLALERFASLDAQVTATPDRIEVRVPLGRRHADLLAHGYLTALAVPWLDGRVVHLMGG